MTCKLMVKHLLFDVTIGGNENATRPFDIGLGMNEIIELRQFTIQAHTGNWVDEQRNAQYALVKNDHRGDNDYATGTTSAFSIGTGGELDKDDDVIVVGEFSKNTVALGNTSSVDRQHYYFPLPFILARSPSLLVLNSVGASLLYRIYATIFYTKKKVSQVELMKCMKNSLGRKHDRTSNAPLHTGEDDSAGA